VVANGKHNEKDETAIENDAYKWACEHFKGSKPSDCNSDDTSQKPREIQVCRNDAKLSIVLAFESLCPGCSQVISGSIADALKHPSFLDMVDLQLLP